MLSSNQISGFVNQLYLKSNWVSQHNFLHADIDWRKVKADLKILVGLGQKCCQPIIFQNSEGNCISGKTSSIKGNGDLKSFSKVSFELSYGPISKSVSFKLSSLIVMENI